MGTAFAVNFNLQDVLAEKRLLPSELADAGEHRYRQLLHHHYRIIHRRVGDKVFIYLVADGRRDMQTLLEQRLRSDS